MEKMDMDIHGLRLFVKCLQKSTDNVEHLAFFTRKMFFFRIPVRIQLGYLQAKCPCLGEPKTAAS
jgi:hypothetical protein